MGLNTLQMSSMATLTDDWTSRSPSCICVAKRRQWTQNLQAKDMVEQDVRTDSLLTHWNLQHFLSLPHSPARIGYLPNPEQFHLFQSDLQELYAGPILVARATQVEELFLTEVLLQCCPEVKMILGQIPQTRQNEAMCEGMLEEFDQQKYIVRHSLQLLSKVANSPDILCHPQLDKYY